MPYNDASIHKGFALVQISSVPRGQAPRTPNLLYAICRICRPRFRIVGPCSRELCEELQLVEFDALAETSSRL